MFLSIRTQKELETLGLNINSPYFQDLSLKAKGHIQAELSKWLDLLARLTLLPECSPPSPDSFWLFDLGISKSLSPWGINVEWNSMGVEIEDDKDLTLFSALADNLSPEERKRLIPYFHSETLEVYFEVTRNHTGKDMNQRTGGLPPKEYPLVRASGRITIKLPKEARDFLTELGKIKEVTEVQTQSRLICEVSDSSLSGPF